MRYIKTRKETIKNVSVLMAAILCLCWITMYLINIKVSGEEIDLEEIMVHSMELEENIIELKIGELYESRGEVVNEEEIGKIIEEVLDATYLSQIQIESKKGSYSVEITYDETNQVPSLSKAKREQVTLLDASLLMSLFNEIDVVTVQSIMKDNNEERVVYRLDLEDYFKMSLNAYQSKEIFAKIAQEFLDKENVSRYWGMKHPFDSSLGQAVEKFYKYNFPSKWDTFEEVVDYIDESFEGTLENQYGYPLWIQGLNYDHPAMNYYAAYKLIGYYGNNNLDEILLELASCKNQSKDFKVQQACQFVMNVLSKNLKSDEVVVFTTYNELELQGGKKLYGLVENQLVEIAIWQGEKPGGFKVISISSDKKSVLCKIHTPNQDYLYIVPINSAGGYRVNETSVEKEEVISRELTNLMKEVALNEEMSHDVIKEIEIGNFQSRWLFKDILILSVEAGESFIYDGQKGGLSSETVFNQEFDSQYLIQGLKERFANLQEKEAYSRPAVYQIKEIMIDTNKIVIYEYESKKQKNMALLKEKQDVKSLKNQWSKGKIYVTYEGEDAEMIRTLSVLMAE